jgi:hypothetical protein
MELAKIEILINKYLEGESSQEEESILRHYFSSEVVDKKVQEYQPIFNFYTEAQKIENAAELPELKAIVKNKKAQTWISIAASIVVLVGVGTYFFLQVDSNKGNLGTYDDPEVAFKETQKALAMLSNHVNTGIEGVHYMQEFENSKNKIFNPIKKNK